MEASIERVSRYLHPKNPPTVATAVMKKAVWKWEPQMVMLGKIKCFSHWNADIAAKVKTGMRTRGTTSPKR